MTGSRHTITINATADVTSILTNRFGSYFKANPKDDDPTPTYGGVVNTYANYVEDIAFGTNRYALYAVGDNSFLGPDNKGVLLGTAEDAKIYWNAVDLVLDPTLVSAGDVLIPADNAALALGGGTGGDARVYYDATNLILDPDVVGSGRVLIGATGDDGLTANDLILTTDLAVAHGGTGLSNGTDGGIPYFNSTSTMATTGVMALNQVMLGGGSAAAPSTLSAGVAFAHLRLNADSSAAQWVRDTKSKSITIEDPVATARIAMWLNEAAVLVVGVSFDCTGGTSCGFEVEFNTTIGDTSHTVIHSDIANVDAAEWDVTPSGTTAVPTNKIVQIDVGVVTDAVTQLVITVHYIENV